MRNLKIKTKKSDITEKFRVKDKIIGCDGGEDYGHPLVYLNLTKDGKQVLSLIHISEPTRPY